MDTMFTELLQDMVFAGIAAFGFAAISNPPRRAYLPCALIAALGHASRFLFIHCLGWHIVVATTVASAIIGIVSVIISPYTKVPSETYLYPSLLPMIPGMYAYRTIEGLLLGVGHTGEVEFEHYLYIGFSNGITCFFILLGMVLGATLPMFILQGISFKATRASKK